MRIIVLTIVYSIIGALIVSLPRNLAEKELREEIEAMNAEVVAATTPIE